MDVILLLKNKIVMNKSVGTGGEGNNSNESKIKGKLIKMKLERKSVCWKELNHWIGEIRPLMAEEEQKQAERERAKTGHHIFRRWTVNTTNMIRW